VKTKSILFRLLQAGSLIAMLGASSSCVTTYDAAGRPVQTVDPGLAVAGVAAAGLVGYAIGQNNESHHSHYHGGGYYGGGYYRPYYGPRCR
jgi:hypothetical protein